MCSTEWAGWTYAGPVENERDRLQQVYDGYGHSRRRRRAWSASNPANVAMRDELKRHLLRAAAHPLAGEEMILDAGCGGGFWLRELASSGIPPSRLAGVDLIDARIAAARDSVPGADIRLADARELPFADGAFGLVLMLTTLSSMPDEDAARSATLEALRVLRPGGLLAVYEPAHGSPASRRLTIRPSKLEGWAAADASRVSVTRLTVAPPLARPLGRLGPGVYGRLGRVPALLTHRLTVLKTTGPS